MARSILKPNSRAAVGSDDPLAQFEAEFETESVVPIHGTRSAAAGPLPVGPLTAGPLSASTPAQEFDTSFGAVDSSELLALEAVLERRISVSWLEAVAIVEATCAALVANRHELEAPDPCDILLTAKGGIEVRTDFAFGQVDSVQRLARMLHVLTSGQAIPAPLRLFASKWIASDGNHSIADFAKELAYFARPNGSDLIREVYRRCMTAPATKKQTASASKQKPENQSEKKASRVFPQPARRSRAALVIAVFSLAFALVIIIAFSRPRQAGEAGSSGLLNNLVAGAAEFGRSLGEVRTQLGNLTAQLSAHLASGADATAPAKPAPAADAQTTSTPAQANTRASTPQAARAPLPARTVPGIATRSTSTARSASAPALDLSALRPPDAGQPESPVAAPNILTPAETVDPDAIYTSADAGINPPKMLYPQLPPPPLVVSTSDNSINVMEIIIGGNGSVERVRLVSQPRRMTDMMLLSGAKSWKFAPASKNGLPVRYRMAFSWATTP
jgi:hypothetical protein